MGTSKYPLLTDVTSGLLVGLEAESMWFANENLCGPRSIAPGVGAGRMLGEGVRAGESEFGEGKLMFRVSVGRVDPWCIGGVGSGTVGGGLRGPMTRRRLNALPLLFVGVFSASDLTLSNDCSPTASRLHVRRSLTGLASACIKVCVRPDIPAARVGLLIAAIGLWAIVNDDLRRLNTRGDEGSEAEVGVPADSGPADPVEGSQADCVRRAASLGR